MMSWNISLSIPDSDQWAYVGNYTWNVGGMYVLAMGQTLSYFRYKKASECIELLQKGVDEMKQDPDTYRAMEPENKWGNYEGALEYLETFLSVCRNNPTSTVYVD